MRFPSFRYFLLILIVTIVREVWSGPPSYKYDYRRNTKKNQASPGVYFDPDSGQFKRGNPPADLLEKSKQMREEIKQSMPLPFAKYDDEADNEEG